jgi:hypothetical protein
MESESQIEPPADEFYILKRGEILGPFTDAAIRAANERGEFSPSDFVQHGGVALWQPLTRWLERERTPLHPVIAPDWKSIGMWAAVRLRHDVLEGSMAIGLGCAAIGTLVVVLAFWPAALWLPWFAIAVVAGIFAMREGRVIPGLLVLLAVAAVPIVFSLIDREREMPARDFSAAVEDESP